MPQRSGSISVFFPAFNDKETIGGIVENAVRILQTLTNDYEVLVINDGSRDGTAAVLDDLARQIDCLRIIHHAENKGYGAAIRTGLTLASKDLIFYTDGDGQYDIREFNALLARLTVGVDVVNGYKISRRDNYGRRVLGAIYNRVAHLLFKLPVRDVDCDFRLIRRHALRQVELTSSSGVICVELVHKLYAAGSVFEEMPVHHYPRAQGRSQFFTVRRVSSTVVDLSALWFDLVARHIFQPAAADPKKQQEGRLWLENSQGGEGEYPGRY